MDWVTRLLIGTLVATGIFVAVVSGCDSVLFPTSNEGGSCTEAHIIPFIPTHATLVDIPLISRILLFLVAIVLVAIAIPKTNYAIDADARRRSRAGPRQSMPFYRRLFLPYLCAMRDP